MINSCCGFVLNFAIAAAHTIGRARCSTISSRLYNFPGTSDGIDPTLNKAYAQTLKQSCPQGSSSLVNMDPSNGGQTFDTNYYTNVLNNKGLLQSDEALLTDNTAKGRLQSELSSPSTFRSDFGTAMEKMGRISVLTNNSPFKGEIRKNCHVINPASSSKIAKTTSKKKSTAKKTVKKTPKKTPKKTAKKTAPKKATTKKTAKKTSTKPAKKSTNQKKT